MYFLKHPVRENRVFCFFKKKSVIFAGNCKQKSKFMRKSACEGGLFCFNTNFIYICGNKN